MVATLHNECLTGSLYDDFYPLENYEHLVLLVQMCTHVEVHVALYSVHPFASSNNLYNICFTLAWSVYTALYFVHHFVSSNNLYVSH